MRGPELAQAWVPGARAAGRVGAEAVGFLRVPGADLLEVGVVELGFGTHLPARPHVHPLGADVYIDAREVPLEEAANGPGRKELHDRGQLLGRLALVALAVGVEIAVVDLGRALNEHHGRILETAAGGIGEEQRHEWIGSAVVGLLGISEPGGDVDAQAPGRVIRGDRPGDRLAGAVDRGQLGGDEAVEHRLDVGGKRRGHVATPYPGSPGRTIRACSPDMTTRGSTGLISRLRAWFSSSCAEAKPDSCSRCLIVGKTSRISPRSAVSRARAGSYQRASTTSWPSGRASASSGSGAR